jgi:hypothetical protein
MTSPRNGTPRPLIATPDGQVTGRTPAAARAEQRWSPDPDPRVFQPAVWQAPAGTQPVGLQHGAAGSRSRLVDAANPPLREALGNALVIVQAGALLLVCLALAATVLIVLTRLWGWLI